MAATEEEVEAGAVAGRARAREVGAGAGACHLQVASFPEALLVLVQVHGHRPHSGLVVEASLQIVWKQILDVLADVLYYLFFCLSNLWSFQTPSSFARTLHLSSTNGRLAAASSVCGAMYPRFRYRPYHTVRDNLVAPSVDSELGTY